MINRTGFRNLLESVGGPTPEGYGALSIRIPHLLGLCDGRGRLHKDHAGNRILKDPSDTVKRLNPSEISLRGLAESLLGEDWEKRSRAIPAFLQQKSLLESDGRSLLEDNGAGAIMASAFADINAFTATATGLLEVGILEAYNSPEFIADKLAPVEPSKIFEGRKTIGAARLGDVAEERLPGMPTHRAQFGERWLTQPRTVENAVAVELTQEAIYLDLTGGQVSEHANSVGEWVAYRKEIRVIDSWIGTGGLVGANGYNVYVWNYKGTAYAPYATAGTYYINDIASGNELLYIDNILSAEILFRNMTDPETGTLINITPNTILVNREKEYTARELFGMSDGQYRSSPGSTSGEQSFRGQGGPNPIKNKYEVIESPLVYQECTSATGLNLSATAAGKKWWLFERGNKTHVYIQNWPLRTQTAAPNQVDLLDRGIVLFVKADERGIPMWKDPHRVVRSAA